jgi:large subunit ribosomal protein L24
VVMGKMRLKRGDTVQVIAGKDAGKTGKVLRVYPDKQRVLVESVNFVMRHTRPTRSSMQGGVVQKEAPLHASNVVLVCSRCGEPTRVSRKRLDDGRSVRICKKCGEVIDRS